MQTPARMHFFFFFSFSYWQCRMQLHGHNFCMPKSIKKKTLLKFNMIMIEWLKMFDAHALLVSFYFYDHLWLFWYVTNANHFQFGILHKNALGKSFAVLSDVTGKLVLAVMWMVLTLVACKTSTLNSWSATKKKNPVANCYREATIWKMPLKLWLSISYWNDFWFRLFWLNVHIILHVKNYWSMTLLRQLPLKKKVKKLCAPTQNLFHRKYRIELRKCMRKFRTWELCMINKMSPSGLQHVNIYNVHHDVHCSHLVCKFHFGWLVQCSQDEKYCFKNANSVFMFFYFF